MLTAASAGTCAVETRAPGYECGRDEVAYDAALKDVDIVAQEEGGGRGGSPDYEDEMSEDEDVEAQDEADDDSDASGGMSVDLEDTVAHRKGGWRPEGIVCSCTLSATHRCRLLAHCACKVHGSLQMGMLGHVSGADMVSCEQC
jgi:hypothetical protein